MPTINNNQFIIDNLLTANEFVFHALDCDKETARLNVIGRLTISSRGSELINKITNRIEIKNSGEEGRACAYLLGEKYSPAGKIVTQETAKFSLPTYMKVLDEILLNEELPFPKNILDSIVTYWKYTKLSWLSFFAIISLTLIPLVYFLAYIKHSDLPQHPMFGIYIVFAISLSAFVLLLWCKKQMNSYWNLKESKKTFTPECDRKTIQALIISTSKQKDSWSLAAREVIEIATKGVESLPYHGSLDQIFAALKDREEKIKLLEQQVADLTSVGHVFSVLSMEMNLAFITENLAPSLDRNACDNQVYGWLVNVIEQLNKEITTTQKRTAKGAKKVPGTVKTFYEFVGKERKLFRKNFGLEVETVSEILAKSTPATLKTKKSDLSSH